MSTLIYMTDLDVGYNQPDEQTIDEKLPEKENSPSILNTEDFKKSESPKEHLKFRKIDLSDYKNQPTAKKRKYKVKSGHKHKSLCTVVKRTFRCEKCNEPLTLNCVAKCMVCKGWFCWNCSEGQIISDYICKIATRV